MPVMGVARFERFFRVAAGLSVGKDDLKRYNDFVDEKIYDLLLIAQATAKENLRDVIRIHDLPLTKGLQERIHEFRHLDEEVELQPILDQIARRPPLDVAISPKVEDRLPQIVGGLSLALARTFTIVEPGRSHPSSESWERALRIFDLLL